MQPFRAYLSANFIVCESHFTSQSWKTWENFLCSKNCFEWQSEYALLVIWFFYWWQRNFFLVVCEYCPILKVGTYQVLGVPHWMANKEHFFLFSLLQHVINDSCKVLCSPFVPAIVPELRAFAACVQGCVISRISVSSHVYHPDIITCFSVSVIKVKMLKINVEPLLLNHWKL
jgi:hypothetical protein